MTLLESMTQGINVGFGVDATPVVSVHDWQTNHCRERSFLTAVNMEQTESSLAADTVKFVHEVGIPIVWTIVEGVTVI